MLAQSYYDPKLFKTNAPPEVIYDIFKSWKSKVYSDDQEKIMRNINPNGPAHRIL
jgi:tRNA (guanine26-N2/guanine27-N2)-dimethyltransferase